jgi:hypothetical protein
MTDPSLPLFLFPSLADYPRALTASQIEFCQFQNAFFVEAMGMSALLVEACLGIPQLLRNFQRKSTTGMRCFFFQISLIIFSFYYLA